MTDLSGRDSGTDGGHSTDVGELSDAPPERQINVLDPAVLDGPAASRQKQLASYLVRVTLRGDVPRVPTIREMNALVSAVVEEWARDNVDPDSQLVATARSERLDQ